MNVHLGIKKSHQVKSSRVSTIDVSRDTYRVRGYKMIEFPFFTTPMSCHRVKSYDYSFFMDLLVFLGK